VQARRDRPGRTDAADALTREDKIAEESKKAFATMRKALFI